jgi:phospholipase A2-like protein
MSRLKYEDLDRDAQLYLTDGCGNHVLDVPDFMWEEACRRHDFGYRQGHTKADRARVDGDWYDDMCHAVDEVDLGDLNHSKWVYKLVATVYFLSVRLASWRYFEFGDRYNTLEEMMLARKVELHAKI